MENSRPIGYVGDAEGEGRVNIMAASAGAPGLVGGAHLGSRIPQFRNIANGVIIVNSRQTGLVLLNVAGILVILGSLFDLLIPTTPENHLHYLGGADGQFDRRFAQLDLAMLRSIGGCLLAIGMTTLILANGPIRRGEMWARLTVVLLVGIAEGNNAYRMFPFDSPWYGPFGFVLISIAGAALATAPAKTVFPAANKARNESCTAS